MDGSRYYNSSSRISQQYRFFLIQLFIRADIIVKSVIIILIASSIYSWAIIFDKYKLFKKINKSSEEFEEKFWKSKSAESFYNNLPSNIEDPMALLFKNTMQIVMKSRSRSNLSEKLNGILEVNIEKQMNNIEKNYTFLATVGSTAPFHWTIWNSMGNNEFISINCNIKKYKFSNCSSWNSRSVVCYCFRIACSNTCGSCL